MLEKSINPEERNPLLFQAKKKFNRFTINSKVLLKIMNLK